MKDKKPFFKKKDLVLIAILVAGALLFMLFIRLSSHKADMVCLYKDNDLIWSAPLGRDGIYDVGSARIEIKNGRVCFLDNDCPDLICVRTGWLSSAGEYAVCVPNHLLLKLSGTADDIDARTGGGGK